MPSYLIQHFLDNSHLNFKDKIAFSSPNSSLTYGKFYILSNKLANCLKDMGIKRQDRVAFCLKRSPNSVVVMLGILKADAIYVPIDPNAPIERFKTIFNDCRPSTIICDVTTIDKVNNLISSAVYSPNIIIFENKKKFRHKIDHSHIYKEDINKYPGSKPIYENVDSDIAYILYTSGSTGTPKGVMVSHFSVFNYISWAAECFGITKNDVILSTAPFHFDMSVFDIYCALKMGAQLSIASDDLMLFPGKLIQFMDREGISIWKGVSSLLMYMARTGVLKQKNLLTLKKIIFAGEVLPTKYLITWMQTYPDKQFYNGYGPTEATGMSMYYLIPECPVDSNIKIPIGKACTNTEVFLLKENDTLAKSGEIGELCIRGSSLSSGYWNDEDNTRKHFVPNPLSNILNDVIYRTGDLARIIDDGNYEFIGRKDHQIKRMGYRIELGEIENALLSIKEVEDACVIMSNSKKTNIDELVTFVELNSNSQRSLVSKKLHKILPNYMIPNEIIPIEQIPRNDRGKIDRAKLKRMEDY